MKKHIFILMSLALMIGACNDYKEEAPSACLKMEILSGTDATGRDIFIETTSAEVGQAVYFGHCSDADKFAIYTGDAGHAYGEQDAIGLNLSFLADAKVTYVYDTPGTFTVTMVATNTSSGSPDVTYLRNTTTASITISPAVAP